MKKREEGVTLIQTVIAVVMIALIASFAIFNSRDTVVETRVAKVYNEILTVKKAVLELEMLEEKGMEIFTESKIQNLDSYPEIASHGKANQEYYYLDFEKEGNLLQEKLDIRNIENNYIVNVKNIEDIEIFLVNGVKIRNEIFYKDDEIIEKYNDIFAGR